MNLFIKKGQLQTKNICTSCLTKQLDYKRSFRFLLLCHLPSFNLLFRCCYIQRKNFNNLKNDSNIVMCCLFDSNIFERSTILESPSRFLISETEKFRTSQKY